MTIFVNDQPVGKEREIIFDGRRRLRVGGRMLGQINLTQHPLDPTNDVAAVVFKHEQGGFAVSGEAINNVPLFRKLGVSWSPQLPSKER